MQRLNYENCKKIRRIIGEFYTISCVSIMKREFFKKILISPKPYLKRWPRGVPFDFEKLSKDNVEKNILDPIQMKSYLPLLMMTMMNQDIL